MSSAKAAAGSTSSNAIHSTEKEDTDHIPSSPKEADTPPPPTFPEGGLGAWLTVLGGSLVLFCTFGFIQSYGIFQDYYTRVSLNDRTTSEVSWIGSCQSFFLYGVSLPVGRLYDNGYFKHLIAFGSLLYVFSLFTLSLVKPHQFYQSLLAQGFGIGIAMGILFLPAISVTSHYFRKRRSIAMGVVIVGSSLGGVIWPIMLNHLFNDTVGFAWGVRTSAFIVLAFLVIAFLLMRTRLPSRRERLAAEKPKLTKILKDVPYLICIMGLFFTLVGLFFPIFYLQLFAIIHGVPRSTALYAIPILNAASIVGRTIPNFMADRWGTSNLVIPCTTISGILIFALFGASNTSGMVAFAIFYGIFSGAFISLTVPTIAIFATSIEEVGLRIGTGLSTVSFALLIGSPIAGALVDSPRYQWDRAIIFNAVMVLTGSACLLVSRSMTVRKLGTSWI